MKKISIISIISLLFASMFLTGCHDRRRPSNPQPNRVVVKKDQNHKKDDKKKDDKKKDDDKKDDEHRR